MNFAKMTDTTLLTSSFLLFTFLLAGCFNEPMPANRTDAVLNQVYLNDKGLTVLTADVVREKGLLFVEKGGKKAQDLNGATSNGTWTNLTAVVKDFAPQKLEYLNLDRNALTNADALAAFTGLKWLRLNDNKLAALPDLKSLANLRRIYLKNNRFASVPETLKDLPALTDIDLSGNPIKEVPAWLTAKPELKHVSLSRTMVEKLPENLDAWTGLQSLQLGELKISPAEMARIRKALPKVAIVF